MDKLPEAVGLALLTLLLGAALLASGAVSAFRWEGGPGLPSRVQSAPAAPVGAPAYLPLAGDGPYPTAGVAAPLGCPPGRRPVVVAGIRGCGP